MKNFLGNLFNTNEAKVNKMMKKADKIISLQDKYEKMTDEQLKNMTVEFKERLNKNETLDDILVEAFAVVREASSRVLGMRHFPVQLVGGMALHDGNIAEMKTGEGKTLVSTLPAYLNALTGKGVFVITVNEYLAARDREEMGKVHEFLGLTVGLIHREMNTMQRKEAYECDIIYGTNSEFGFDYLRDNMAVVKNNVVQRELSYVIIDEIDSVLIDESRTPLIIAGQGNLPSQYYMTMDKFVKSLKKDKHLDIDKEKRYVDLNEAGIEKLEKVFKLDNMAEEKNMELLHHIRQSLQANHMMKKDQDYVVKDGEIVIVDKFTGRLMPGRRYSNGLHQAIEAKENVEIQKESKTLATITYQNYFKMFSKISGMTGTAYTEKDELKKIYGMDVISIPTNKPVIRIEREDIIYKTEKEKINAIVEEIKKRHKKGQPVLVGSTYIDKSEKISKQLKKNGISHKLLNAKQDKNEAEIITQAGQKGAVTIATNMAGRGTDIKLGKGVEKLGGLFVIGTEKHDARRIDNQLKGRAGRQGDSGETQFIISLEDKIFEKYGKDSIKLLREKVDSLNIQKNEPIENREVKQSVQNIQKSIEGVNYRIRENTFEFDAILNKQRENIYKERNMILDGEDMSDFIRTIIRDTFDKAVEYYSLEQKYPEDWDLKGLHRHLNKDLGFKDKVNLEDMKIEEIEKLTKEGLKESITEEGYKIYGEREKTLGTKKMRYVERLVLMKAIDRKWMEHLDTLEQIRQGIGMQAIGVDTPIRVFNKEAVKLFNEMMDEVKAETVKYIFSLVTKDEVVEKVKKKKKKLTEEELKQNLLRLEEKYKVSQKQLPKIPANLPQIGFNIDINATEEIEAEIKLYYFGNGEEERLKEYDQKVNVKGIFPIKFDKPKENDWKQGWYQAKIFVVGQEATSVNFRVSEPQDLEEMQREAEKKQALKSDNVRFYSNRLPSISLKLVLEGFEGEKLDAQLMHNNKNIANFEIPVKDNKVMLNIEKPKTGWVDGLYSLVLITPDKKQIVISFMVVDEYENENEDATIGIKIKINIPEGQTVNMIGQLVHLESKKGVVQIPISVSKSDLYTININAKENKFEKGRYEFRLVAGNKVVMTKHFIVS